MSSDRQIAASRANGARSRGPKTAEGKRRSSRNAIRHGLLARNIVLENECRENFLALLLQHEARFAPADGIDAAFIEEMAAAFWRMRRLWAIETRILDNAVAARPAQEDPRDAIAGAFGDLAATAPQLALMHRYETRLHRIYQRALGNLLKLREYAVPNEPRKLIKTKDSGAGPQAGAGGPADS